jgi:hypothetical protein
MNSFLKGFTSLFDWMFPQSYQEMSDDLDEKMQNLYTKMGWGDYKNPMPNSSRNFINPSWNTSVDINKQNDALQQTLIYTNNGLVPLAQDMKNSISNSSNISTENNQITLTTSSKFLDELLKLSSSETFQPYVFYNKDMDSIEASFKDEGYYTKTLNNNIELYISFETGEVVGIKLLNVQKIIYE